MGEELIRDIDEREFIKRLVGILGSDDKGVVVGAGKDDCAILEIGDESLVVTTDMLHRKTDFPPGMSARQIGWMAAAVNFSDIAAMGAKPIGLLAAVGYPPDMPYKEAAEISKGMRDCASFCGTSVIGGDVDIHDELTITGTAFGKSDGVQLLRRSGAKEGDLVCVTGTLGGAGAALQALLEDMNVDSEFLKALFEPIPRIAEGRKLAESGFVTSAMDTSDGLAMSLYDLAETSNVGFKIYESSLPIDERVKQIASNSSDELELALYSGGDFELLFTVNPERVKSLHGESYLTVVGEVVGYERGVSLITGNNENLAINRKGYLHMKSSGEI
ncbi:thiamine-monophosphate kinase [Methanohalophilus levihalophilus]|uniref:thiamine-phosphate kinase n=1 Tax=Methanohalophilus levihalophilus TaxID=1431282 RepID=UPI001AEAB28A|nr:thiamine-phosphate kinase [Methanohalophilus levihalophilus]MBP2030195.1 thiamine-monophosphate kinase [Methanohalophilus levihalophilus]